MLARRACLSAGRLGRARSISANVLLSSLGVLQFAPRLFTQPRPRITSTCSAARFSASSCQCNSNPHPARAPPAPILSNRPRLHSIRCPRCTTSANSHSDPCWDPLTSARITPVARTRCGEPEHTPGAADATPACLPRIHWRAPQRGQDEMGGGETRRDEMRRDAMCAYRRDGETGACLIPDNARRDAVRCRHRSRREGPTYLCFSTLAEGLAIARADLPAKQAVKTRGRASVNPRRVGYHALWEDEQEGGENCLGGRFGARHPTLLPARRSLGGSCGRWSQRKKKSHPASLDQWDYLPGLGAVAGDALWAAGVQHDQWYDEDGNYPRTEVVIVLFLTLSGLQVF
ncbi:hypothetical protein A0H81_11298 [Grifola frondosa]|uniref:Uncharacterized protein n=1 Tax=Grifola frondosa TaxID=5627 RepID=A0A1C7LWH9_GRIFR|nr:hypothetical protein A0H81_11298 [Grifola frondosa]